MPTPIVTEQFMVVSPMPLTEEGAKKAAESDKVLMKGYFGATSYTFYAQKDQVAELVFESDRNQNQIARAVVFSSNTPVATRSRSSNGTEQIHEDLGDAFLTPLVRRPDNPAKWMRKPPKIEIEIEDVGADGGVK